jgi:hypothetical protein
MIEIDINIDIDIDDIMLMMGTEIEYNNYTAERRGQKTRHAWTKELPMPTLISEADPLSGYTYMQMCTSVIASAWKYIYLG